MGAGRCSLASPTSKARLENGCPLHSYAVPCICKASTLYTHAVQPFHCLDPSRYWLISLLMQHTQHQHQHQHYLSTQRTSTPPLGGSGGSSLGPGQGHNHQGPAGGTDISVELTPTAADAAELSRTRCEARKRQVVRYLCSFTDRTLHTLRSYNPACPSPMLVIRVSQPSRKRPGPVDIMPPECQSTFGSRVWRGKDTMKCSAPPLNESCMACIVNTRALPHLLTCILPWFT